MHLINRVACAHCFHPSPSHTSVASHYGGVRNPMIISWPKRIKEEVHGQVRTLRLKLRAPIVVAEFLNRLKHRPRHTHTTTQNSSGASGTT